MDLAPQVLVGRFLSANFHVWDIKGEQVPARRLFILQAPDAKPDEIIVRGEVDFFALSEFRFGDGIEVQVTIGAKVVGQRAVNTLTMRAVRKVDLDNLGAEESAPASNGKSDTARPSRETKPVGATA